MQQKNTCPEHAWSNWQSSQSAPCEKFRVCQRCEVVETQEDHAFELIDSREDHKVVDNNYYLPGKIHEVRDLIQVTKDETFKCMNCTKIKTERETRYYTDK